MIATLKKHTLQFTFDAGTSRGVLREKKTWYLILEKEGIKGIGEAGPLAKLSIDDVADFEQLAGSIVAQTNSLRSYEEISDLVPAHLPALRFALQTAWKDLENGGNRIIFNNDFSLKNSPIAINGLVWMNQADHMIQQVDEKLRQGYTCIKIKVGAIDFEEEKRVIAYIRSQSASVAIRLDANGAWTYEEALDKLTQLKPYGIHSIEQPIKAGQIALMGKLCRKKIIDIALDEELIGINNLISKKELLTDIAPQYIILKPTLLGGFDSCDEWIQLAENMHIGWWNTSALESNIGLNAICQYSYQKNSNIMHGLGTGMLYSNNIASPLQVQQGEIQYVKDKPWGFAGVGL